MNFGNPKVEAIAAQACDDLMALFRDHEGEVIQHLNGVQEGKALAFSHSIKLDFEKNKQKSKLSFSTAHGGEVESEIPDPNQMKLDMQEVE